MRNTFNTVQSVLKRNSPIIFSSTAIAGVATTGYLAARASFTAARKIDNHELLNGVNPGWKKQTQERAALVWKLYIPAAASGVVTIACVVGTTRVTNKRAAAAQAAFVLSERAYAEYRNKVIEEYGERKDKAIRDTIAEERVRQNPPPATLIAGSGSVICCELHTGRYFTSDMETLRRAENDINARLVRHDSATLDDWYYLIRMQPTTNSGDLGWNSDKLLSLEFTSVLDDNGRPCLAFEYNYVKPLYDGMWRE